MRRNIATGNLKFPTLGDVKDYADLQVYFAERGMRFPNTIQLGRGIDTPRALIDPEDLLELWNYKWTYRPRKDGLGGYAVHNFTVEGQSYSIPMHRFLLDVPEGMIVDHRDGNGLNNRRSNLRICTPAENSRNRRPHLGRKYKGVYRRGNSYFASICVNGKSIYLGTFEHDEAAASAYDRAAKIYHGDFAYFNFPTSIAS